MRQIRRDRAMVLKLEDILGVYILDDTRLPEGDIEQFFHQETKLHLYLDANKQPSYRYHYYTLDNRKEVHIFEEGWIALGTNRLYISFSIVDKYEIQTFHEHKDKDFKKHDYYEPPRMEVLPIVTENGFCLVNKGDFYIPIAKDIFGRKSEDIERELFIMGHYYRENWID
jgi:hypothetical protein